MSHSSVFSAFGVRFQRFAFRTLALLVSSLLVYGDGILIAQQSPAATPPAGGPAGPAAAKLSADQLDSLVAPIALYPDPLLAQTLVASTYPLEVVQLQQWLAKNPTLNDKALADAVAKQAWDPAIQSMAAVPEVVKRLAGDIQWTTQLGDAFLEQQSDVMDAVQRMRKKAQDKGTLTSTEQMKVETKVIEEKTVIVVEQTNPQVVYVPSYDPVVVYGPAYSYYPYPPIYYPPYYGGAWISFGVGMMWGAAIWGGSCCGCSWGGGNININNNNNFNRNQVNPLGGDGNRGGDRGGNRGEAEIRSTRRAAAGIAARATIGRTTHSIAAGRHTRAGKRRTSSAGRRAVIPAPAARGEAPAAVDPPESATVPPAEREAAGEAPGSTTVPLAAREAAAAAGTGSATRASVVRGRAPAPSEAAALADTVAAARDRAAPEAPPV